MSFDIQVAREAQHTRVAIKGEATLGQLVSLLHVLQVDSQKWPRDEVVLDLLGLERPLPAADLARVQEEAARLLPWMPRFTIR